MYRLKIGKIKYTLKILLQGKHMQKISIDELIENKVLEFNLYDAQENKVFEAGEVLTPGKIMQLKELGDLYKGTTQENPGHIVVSSDEDRGNAANQKNTESYYSMDDMDISNFKGSLCKLSVIEPEFQLKLKAFYIYIMNSMGEKKIADIIQMYSHLRDKIISDIVLRSDNVSYFSEIRLMGQYDKSHSINVAILAGILALRMGLKETLLSDIVLGGLLHDIGKIKLPQPILEQQTLTDREQKIYQTHTKLGYKILREHFGYNENIARIALEHHEHNNGSGYPYGKSGDFISKEARIVNVCNCFDNLVSNIGSVKIHNCHEACKMMIEDGSKRFSAGALYKFVNMFSYNDTKSLDEMIV